MADDDELRNIALAVLAGVVGLVIAGVVGLAIGMSLQASPTTAREAGSTTEALCFETGSDRLPADAMDVLARVADAVRSRNGSVAIVALRDAAAPQGEPLAGRRLASVRHGLEADGVAPEQMSSSVEARRAGDACRIEMRVQ